MSTHQSIPELVLLREKTQIRKAIETSINELVDQILRPIVLTRQLNFLNHSFLIIQYLRKIIESEVKKQFQQEQEQAKQEEIAHGKYIDIYANGIDYVQWNNIIIGKVKTNFQKGTHEHHYSKYILKPKYWSQIEEKKRNEGM